MPKVDISMSPEEVEDFLRSCPTMVLACIGDDGWPTGALARSSYQDGVLSLRLNAADPILDCVAVDREVCCVADEHASYYGIRGVIVHGRRRLPDRREAGRVDVPVEHVISFDFARLRFGP
jgi:nitroimidazol reductase NimA-like FMN-containing flavoprotein (pyridoxamine 5'-phosphate oxidase superfamily)